MANHTQEQIDIIIQQIMDAEDPCTVTNQMVATVLLFLMDAAKEQPNLTASIMGLSDTLNTLLSGNANEAIESFNEVIAFLEGVTDEQTLTGLLLNLHNEIADKASKARDGRLNPQEAPVVMLDSMGSILDSVGSTTTVMHVAAQGDYIFSTGVIKYYKTYKGTGNPDNEVVSLGPPQQGLIYCNKKTGLQYSWTGSDTGWVQVGRGRVINDLTTGGTIDALSAEMGKELDKIKPTIDDTIRAEFEIVDDDDNPILQIVGGYVITSMFNSSQLSSLYQTKLVSGVNIKTINNESILGKGNITISGVPGGTISDIETIRTNSQKAIAGITTQQDGTIVLTLVNGDAYTINLNHTHSQYITMQVLTQAEYDSLTTKDSRTLYIIQ